MVKKLAYAGIAGAVVSVAFLTAAPAQAAARDGICQSGEFCLYYNSDNAGSVSDFTTSIDDYGASQPECYEFKGAGAGQGQCVKNNAASVWNRTSGSVTVFYNSGYSGDSQSFASGAKGNLNATLKNDNAGHRLGGGTSTNVDMSDALYVGGGGHITCGFDGYVNTPGRHEGIDIAKASGSSVKALLSGTVTNVVEGGTGLSTIAVYNATFDKTIIYLHTNPNDSVDIGDMISKGQQIAVEAARGAGSASHTHVEMRLGRKTLAAKSVDDPVLDNPNPTSFWQARGYNVR
ncbi:peptidase inhibitor family I36 protein [Pedococcus bigeumensis]|uniref:Cell surface protein n=1 Tax=Pedococcus bigeumensis TaxID=433644 RepID=A0A502CZN4_9MICO|nr:peptidase inhibitor family I36 protein [Pedococcus bigeumensis]TPG17221.1 cell surface protein [Pedococcus bigeumensis]